MAELLKAMILVLASWAALFFIFGGVGTFTLIPFGLRPASARWWFLSFWLGWALTLAILQLWHLALPVNWLALCLVWLLGMAGLFLHWRGLWALLKRIIREQKRMLLVLALIGLWLSNLALGPVANGDTGLYHLPSVRWAQAYPIVPGLGNLHGRLAFNSSYFLYAALLDVGEWAGRTQHLANGLLTVVLLAQTLLSVPRLFTSRGLMRVYHLFNTLLIAPILIAAATGITNLSADTPVFMLSVLMVAQTLFFLINIGKMEKREESFLLFWIAALACAGITVKLSFGALALAAFLVALGVWLARSEGRTGHHTVRTLGWVFGAAAFLLAPWMARGVILSGYIAYPSVMGSFPVPWRVPRDLVISEANWTRSWPRQPQTFWAEVLGNLDWLRSWATNLSDDVMKSLQIAFVALLSMLLPLKPGSKERQLRPPLWLFLIPAVVSLIFWFASAPNPRFVMASFWTLAGGATALAATRLIPQESDHGAQNLALFLLCFAFFAVVSPLRKPLLMSPGTDEGFHALPQAKVQKMVTDSGLTVSIPTGSSECWDAPLPCTPYFRHDLQLLQQDDMSRGFRLDTTPIHLDMHGYVPPSDIIASPGLGVTFLSDWYAFEPESNVRWMKSPGRILIYTEKPKTVKLFLKPFKMAEGKGLGDAGRLMVSVNNSLVATLSVQRDVTSEVILHLHRDFNIITLRLAAGNFVPKEVDPTSTDSRSLGVAFYPIEIRAEP